ncbi:MAG TPA: TolC family outer membrane protein [Candidatus Berkiella sp.]|nr:TolC family outer membrane protein [Candidatus Berkiella sp.]
MRFRHLIFVIASFGAIHFAKAEEDLWQIYQLATESDPTLKAAYANLQANQQSLPQAVAQMIPNLSASYNTTGVNSSASFQGDYNTQNYSLNLTQPLYHPEHWAQLDQARHVVKGAYATYYSATQALMIRVSQQYFAILGAIDDLHFTQAQRKAFARQLEQTKQRFEVGLIAITDVEEARARHDKAVAEEIAAQNAVADQYERLREITGTPIKEITLFQTTKSLPLLPPNPETQETWVETAEHSNPDIIAAAETALQAKAVIGAQVAGHYPKFDLTGQLQRSKGAPPFPFDQLVYNRVLALNVSVPLFSGGGVYSRTQEATARYCEARERLEIQKRSTDSTTRQAYRGVLTSISEVQALAQTVVSSKSALQATLAAYEVGTRTMVDVLDAESNLLNAERTHAKARYNYLFQGLRLKQAAGILTAEDIAAVNALIRGLERPSTR